MDPDNLKNSALVKHKTKISVPDVNRAKDVNGNTPDDSLLISQILESVWLARSTSSEDKTKQALTAFSMFKDIGPVDAVEGMLAAQMVGVHNAAMESLRRAMIPDQSAEVRDQVLKQAATLMLLYTRQMEALNKHRGKGQQKVTVEYVNVEQGGQAVVGNVQTGQRLGSGDIKDPPKVTAHRPKLISK